MLKKLLLATVAAASLGGVTLPAMSQDVIVVEKAPPPLREEVVPAPRTGYIWVAGHWDWRDDHYAWVAGTWVRERPGYVYHRSEWRQRDGHWEMVHESWARGDRDGDGVPDRADRRPDDPNRY